MFTITVNLIVGNLFHEHSALKVHNGHKLLNSLSFGELDQLKFDGLTYPLLTQFSAINAIRCLFGDSAVVTTPEGLIKSSIYISNPSILMHLLFIMIHFKTPGFNIMADQ